MTDVGRTIARWSPAALAISLGLALLVRQLAAMHLPFRMNEPNSVLGAAMIANGGFPVLPSGILYLHGATVSYLMALLLALGIADIDNLLPLRLISVVAGTAAVYVTYLLAKRVFGETWVAIGAAFLLALDPFSVLWSGQARMYALEQLFVALTALAFVDAIDRVGASGRRLIWLVLAFWLAVYSYLGAALLWPAMVLVALVLYGRTLLTQHRDLLLALGASLLAPVSLAVLSTLFGGGAGTSLSNQTDYLPGLSVLGDQNIELSRLLQPSLAGWLEMFEGGRFSAVLPVVVAILSGLLVGHWLLAAAASDQPAAVSRRVGTLLALYWGPVALFAFTTGSPEPRYLTFLQPLAYALVAGGVGLLLAGQPAAAGAQWSRLAAGAAVLLVAGNGVSALFTFDVWGAKAAAGGGDGDYRRALEVVAKERAPGDLVLVNSPQMGYLEIGDIPARRFLPGEVGVSRAERYARTDPLSGTAVDYWIGMEVIDSVATLCGTLSDHPGSWIVLHKDAGKRGLHRGPVTDIVRGSADLVYDDDDLVVFRSRQADTWDGPANRACRDAKAA
jgi:hypothetical protein